MHATYAIARRIGPRGLISTRSSRPSPLASRSLAPFIQSYATDTSKGDSEPIASSSTSSAPSPQPPTREQLFELFKQAEGAIDLDELMASASQGIQLDEDPTQSLQDMYPLDETIQEFKGDDSTSLGHRMLAEERIILEYFRKIEMEMPSLKALRKPFRPQPASKSPIIARTISFGGQKNIPSSQKGVLVVPASNLPLSGHPDALHKFKILAGVRWSLDPPKDAGLSKQEVEKLQAEGAHGYLKISHEAFPELAMNLKWCSDTLDKLLVEANNAEDSFSDIPLDTRHLDSQVQKRRTNRPTISDFPKEWLATPAQVERLRKQVLEPRRRRSKRSAPIIDMQVGGASPAGSTASAPAL